MKQTVTVPQLCKVLGLPETTARRFIRGFGAFFPVATSGRPVRYRSEAIEVLRLVVDCHNRGMTQGETEAALAGSGFAREAEPAAKNQPPTANQEPKADFISEYLAVRLATALERQNVLLERQNELLENLARAGVALPGKFPSDSRQEAQEGTEWGQGVVPAMPDQENALKGDFRPSWWKRLFRYKR